VCQPHWVSSIYPSKFTLYPSPLCSVPRKAEPHGCLPQAPLFSVVSQQRAPAGEQRPRGEWNQGISFPNSPAPQVFLLKVMASLLQPLLQPQLQLPELCNAPSPCSCSLNLVGLPPQCWFPWTVPRLYDYTLFLAHPLECAIGILTQTLDNAGSDQLNPCI